MSNYEAQLKAASEALSNKEYAEALLILKPLVSEEIAGALGLLGAMYQLGEGVPQNGKEAVKLLSRAVELGDGTSAHNLGTIYCGGLPDVQQNYEKSKMYYRKAKEMGAQFAPNEFYE